MMKKKLQILDSTLREGAQSEGISFSVEDKKDLYRTLSELGIDLIEGGNPGSNQKDREFFNEMQQENHDRLVSFGSTCRVGSKPEEDLQCQTLLATDTVYVVIFGKCSSFQVREVLGCSEEENLRIIRETITYFVKNGKKVIFDCEHFFDGIKDNEEYTVKCLSQAVQAGAEVLCLCDTNGGFFPEDIRDYTFQVVQIFPETVIGIHCHNDCGLAVANTIAAVQAGATHVQGTFLGYGERCGNASICTIIGDLQVKGGYECIPEENIRKLTDTARYVSDICNVSLPDGEPFVGRGAFSHKAGMHADGVEKNHAAFEHLVPEKVGNHRRFLLSEIAGRALTTKKIKAAVPGVKIKTEQITAIIKKLKQQEYLGYTYEAAEASFEILVRRELGLMPPKFEILMLRTMGEHPARPNGSATAMIKIRVGNREEFSASEGNGPVNALDLALRQTLEVFYPQISEMRLIDFKVRVIDSGSTTAARVRVLITSTDGKNTWATVGVSEDVIEASFQALRDSVEYKLLES